MTLNAREFRVRDNGPGISPQALTRIGERFYRPPGQERERAAALACRLSGVSHLAWNVRLDFANAREVASRPTVLVSDIIAQMAKDFAHFAHFTASLVG